ncbi:uncharacterized protein LOC103714271 [Phoenix dactylifera]|uniref:Uncharacterized protein LOC103714271 n=1 Tax=Phoenix dactylifera TaxID=42345 RepID=A0A8B7MW52_PHODC|nr:uncharacterized protein LOC103714271 [Phoenix dactylifera]
MLPPRVRSVFPSAFFRTLIMSTPRLEAKPSLRRPAISVPAVLDLNGGGDFNLHHWRRADSGYTSLRDILTSSSSSSAGGGLLSPSSSVTPGAGEIQIRNRLVKQAAYAYLQPTPSSLESSRRHRRCRRDESLRRLLAVLSCGLAGSCFHFVGRFLQSIRRSRR